MGYQHAIGPSGPPRPQFRVHRQEFWRRSDDLDHLFGTYQAELPDIKIRYGLSHPRSSPSNPFVIAYEDLWRMLKELVSARGWRAWFHSVLGPPA
jgi:hypothetical protein